MHRSTRRNIPTLLTILVAGALIAFAGASPALAQQNSGATVKEFLAALDRGDIDGAMAKWVANPEIEVASGETYTTPEAVRAYFEAFPRPIEVRATLPWGGRRYEAQITAGGTPLLLTFLGADGAIAHMYVEPDPAFITE